MKEYKKQIINQKINNTFARKPAHTEKSKIKGKDLGLFNKVVGFLEEKGSNYEIKGSLARSGEKGRARQYQDIDILVHEGTAGSDKARYAFEKAVKNSAEEGMRSFSSHITADDTLIGMYLLTTGRRFFVDEARTGTSIDILFQDTTNRKPNKEPVYYY